MENLTLANKKTQYTAKANAANVKIEGQVSLDDNLKVVSFNGSVTVLPATTPAATPQPTFGSFNCNGNNISVNLNTNKEYLSEASQLILDTITEIEKTLIIE